VNSGRRRRGLFAPLGGAALLAACGGDGSGGDGLFVPPPPPVPLVAVSGLSSFAAGCDQQTSSGTLYVSAEVEPSLAVNPMAAENLVGAWQQDRWSDGGARGLLAAVSFDGGASWSTRTVPFSRCTGGHGLNGGDYARATDPWVSIGADGSAFFMAMVITDTPTQAISAMRVSRSTDDGDTWEAPVTLIRDTTRYFNDKNSITADPVDAGHAYAVWDRLDADTSSGPAMLARTTDGGDSWEEARVLYDPGANAQTLGNQVAVLPDGTVINLFTQINYGTDSVPSGALVRIVRSPDKGATWGAPVTVGQLLSVGTRDPRNGQAIRDGGLIPTIAVGPDGGVWVAWQDARFSGGARDGIVLAHSADGGLSWSEPALVTDPDVPAFTPALAVAADGTLGLTYYDQRDDTADAATLLTGYWLATTGDGGANWTERRISGPFDHAIAPNARGLFLGDYAGLVAAGTSFVPLFAQTYPGYSNRTNIYAVALPTVTVVAKALPQRGGGGAVQAQAMTPEWARRTGAFIDRSRHHFPDRPGTLPAYLR